MDPNNVKEDAIRSSLRLAYDEGCYKETILNIEEIISLLQLGNKLTLADLNTFMYSGKVRLYNRTLDTVVDELIKLASPITEEISSYIWPFCNQNPKMHFSCATESCGQTYTFNSLQVFEKNYFFFTCKSCNHITLMDTYTFAKRLEENLRAIGITV